MIQSSENLNLVTIASTATAKQPAWPVVTFHCSAIYCGN